MMPVLLQASKVAAVSDISVLLQGETGTGKQILARAIHQLDKRRSQFPFVTIHCSTITESLAESELFGHQRGAFSGAVSNRKGLFREAEGGTAFLDDVNDLNLPLQPKLLDVLQRGIVRPLGSDQEQRVTVRVIAACNEPLWPLVLQRRFRSDLYHRLNVVRIVLPPLRERTGELSTLLLALAQRHCSLYQPIEKIEPELVSFLETQPFPGNIRELENAVRRMLFLKSQGTSLELADWIRQSEPTEQELTPDFVNEAGATVWKAIKHQGIPLTEVLWRVERQVLEAALRSGGRTRREIAAGLRTSERTLYHKIRSHRLTHRIR